jgi:nicotinate-nucleotide pyrophosphorylase (carboxylating)
LDIFRKLDQTSTRRFEVVHHPEMFDGVRVRKGQAIAVIRGNARTILACERVTLNLLQRMCGIATETRKYVDAVAGTGVVILDTRKTAPGLRLLDKYAVSCGGGQNHRMDLADGVLIKNNHISLGGGIAKVLALALQRRPRGQKIQVEVRSFEELEEALAGGADSLLLDNMTPAEVKRAVAVARKHIANIPIEVSGGITLETVRKYAQTGVTYISVGALTHSVSAIDLSMKITAEIF